jgi:hypothetical protein
MRVGCLSGLSIRFRMLSRSKGQVAYVLLTRPPLTFSEASSLKGPLDLHVLGTPPAFVLSQDQTLHKRSNGPVYRRAVWLLIHSGLSRKKTLA